MNSQSKMNTIKDKMVLTVAAIAYHLMITMHVNTWNANAIKLKKENNYYIGQCAKCIIVAVG